MSKRQPLAVLISDVHFSMPNLELATKALDLALEKADELGVPCIIAGDLHDTKANIRGECVNAIRDALKASKCITYVLVGNHDKINEKSEEHSLNFIEDRVIIINEPTQIMLAGFIVTAFPYYHNSEWLKEDLKKVEPGTIVIMHQGITGSNSGEYIQDKSAITTEDVKDFRVISGHYHTRQDIKCGRPQKGAVGLFSYIGNPYTQNFAEANDPPKGFQILMDDGLLEFVPTNLRKHVVVKAAVRPDNTGLHFEYENFTFNPGDLLWVKLEGSKETLLRTSKQVVSVALPILSMDFRLDLIPTDTTTEAPTDRKEQTQGELLDSLIDSMQNTSDERKARLKELWRNSCQN